MKVQLSFAFLFASSSTTVIAFLSVGQEGGARCSLSSFVATRTAALTAATSTSETESPEILPGGMIFDEADEAELLAKSTFPIAPEDLIKKCKSVIVAQAGIQDGTIDESIYADDFKFVAPFIGGPTPREDGGQVEGLDKKAYLSALRSFDLLQAFPDMDNRYHRFYVDPFEPNRVWFQTRCIATHTGELMGGSPTGKSLELPPQSFSMVFNEQGQVTKFDVGYVIDRTVGNTGGLGGAFGFFWATGNALPFPECEPFQPSLQLQFLGLLGKLQKLLPGGEEKED